MLWVMEEIGKASKEGIMSNQIDTLVYLLIERLEHASEETL